MKTLTIFLVFVAFVASEDQNEYKTLDIETNSTQTQHPRQSLFPDGRIVGGQSAKSGQFPYQAGLVIRLNEGSTFCGGTLISKQSVLTAAHCCERAKEMTVILGSVQIFNKTEPSRKEMVVSGNNIKIHEKWSSQQNTNDICILKLPEQVPLSENIAIANLPRDDSKDFNNESVIGSGWGRDSDNSHTVSPVLRYGKMKILSNFVCRLYFMGSVYDTNICTNGRGGVSTCNGDSGGPIVLEKNFQRNPIIVGITSFGSARGCERGWPAVYTRVSKYLSWINKILLLLPLRHSKMTVISIYDVTLWCLVIRAIECVDWTKVKPMQMVAMYSTEGQPMVFNLESERLQMDLLPSGASIDGSSSDAIMERIFGGTMAKPNAFPYQAGMMLQRAQGLYWCGGSLISDEYILTAAHCVDAVRRALIFLGAHEIRNRDEDGQKRIEVTKRNFLIHPEWNARRLRNDIALVKLPEPITFTERIQPIALPRRSYEYKDFSEKLAIASGWGRYAPGVHAISNTLRYVRLRIIDVETCSRSFPFTYQSTNICTSGMNGKSTCHGDSGGPLVVRKKSSKKRILIGLTSFGSVFGCDKGYPAAYTKIVSYLDWILDETGIEIEYKSSDDETNIGGSGELVDSTQGLGYRYE
ncbi:uncharacterized protein LOC129945214 [Eupeodes corollae]|uniref:uncharacterized protein LOC129945214 n=1 Tax=Eupeodes corollae TaxID=290404 RepID=UPI002493B4F6|nr:uncharacterized protein LOC129945214 [Eupeodes corollae]